MIRPTLDRGAWLREERTMKLPSPWPSGRPFPTAEEYAAAEERYTADLRAYREAGHVDSTDWPCGLQFVMMTYASPMWLPFFFPKEKFSFMGSEVSFDNGKLDSWK